MSSKGSVNKVILVGRIGQDAEAKVSSTGSPVVKFSIATTEEWTDRDGNKKEKTEWHRVVMFGQGPAKLSRYLTKGKLVYVEGRLTNRQWEDEATQQKRYATEVNGLSVTFLASPSNGQGGTRKSEDNTENLPEEQDESSFGEEDMGDEIPF